VIVNKSLTSADATSSKFHGALPATVATLLVAAALAPFAYAQFGPIGPWIIAAFAGSIIVSVWVAAWGAARLAQSHPLLASLFASSGVRMIAPFAIALAVAIGHGRIAPIESIYYVVPLYLCMLVADVFVWVREARALDSSTGAASLVASLASGEVV